VKEYYFYLDSTPTHSYMKSLYKYPQQEFPYPDLLETNRRPSKEDFEYELLDTGIFDADRYFDASVEYAKADPEDILIRISVHNRGPETAELHLLPTLWFRNTSSRDKDATKPTIRQVEKGSVLASHAQLGDRTLDCDGNPDCCLRKMNPMPVVCGGSRTRRPMSRMHFTITCRDCIARTERNPEADYASVTHGCGW
jgi:hypothetical protein